MQQSPLSSKDQEGENETVATAQRTSRNQIILVISF